MESEEKSHLKPFQKHIFVCTGSKCAPETSSDIYVYLKDRLRELGKSEGNDRIARSKCHCLGICQGGPLAVVYPDNVWYQSLTKEKMEEVIQKHLISGQPVEDYRLYPDPA